MGLIEYSLESVEDIAPWTDAQRKNVLSWYGISSGFYWINVGDQTLFQYSDEYIQLHMAEECKRDPKWQYFDYYVSRLYEDLLTLLPNSLQVIPDNLLGLVGDINSSMDWQRLVYEAYDDGGGDDEIGNAAEWWEVRRLQGMGGGPEIAIFRCENNIVIRWDCSGLEDDGVQVWSATRGECILEIDEFQSEIDSFSQRFLTEMSARVRWLGNQPTLLKSKGINIDALVREDGIRQGSLVEAKTRDPYVKNWIRIASSLKQLGITIST